MDSDALGSLDSVRWELELAFVTLLSALITGFFFLTTRKRLYGTSQFRNVGADHRYYFQLAKDASECTTPHFCRRILKPFLADALPMDLQSGFMLVTLVSLITVGVLVYGCCRAYGFSFETGVVGMLLYFQLRQIVPYNVMNFWMVDSLAFVFLCAGFYAILTDRDVLFLGSLLVGVLAKETLMMLLPLYYGFRAARPIDISVAKRTGLYAVPAIIIFVGLNAVLTLDGGVNLLGKFSLTYHLVDDPERFVAQFTLLPFGLSLALPFFALKRNVEPFVRSLPFLAVIYGQLLLATDAKRLTAWAFPVMIVLSLHGVESLSDTLDDIDTTTDFRPIFFAPALLGLIATNLYINYPWWFNSGIDIALFLVYTAVLYLTVITSGYWRTPSA